MAPKSRRADRLWPDGVGSRRTKRAARPPAGRRRPRRTVPARPTALARRRDPLAPQSGARFIGASEWTGRGLWANLACRKRFIGDKLDRSRVDAIDAVVILGAGLDTRAYRLTRRIRNPGLRGGPAGQHRPEGQDGPAGAGRARRFRFGWWRWTSSTTTCSPRWPSTATAPTTGRSSSGRASPNTSPRTPSARTLEGLRADRAGQPIGVHLRPPRLHRRHQSVWHPHAVSSMCARAQQLWHFGLQPEEVAAIPRRVRLAAGGTGRARRARRSATSSPPDRKLKASQMEWSAYAEKDLAEKI